jgi:putative ATPase
MGAGKGYLYPHDYPSGWVAQRYLPDGIGGGYYIPSERGYEVKMIERRKSRGQGQS